MFKTIVIALGLLATVPVYAGGRATLEAQRPKSGESTAMTLVWQDKDTVRVNIGERDNTYLLLVNDKGYSVTRQDGEAKVFPLSAFSGAMGAVGGYMADKDESSKGASGEVIATDRTETIAGIKGKVYVVKSTDSDGQTRSMEVVLTDNPLVEEMSTVYMHAIKTLFGMGPSFGLVKNTSSERKGVLRLGDSFKLTKVERINPPKEVFALPAKPMDLRSMMLGNCGSAPMPSLSDLPVSVPGAPHPDVPAPGAAAAARLKNADRVAHDEARKRLKERCKNMR